MKISQVASSIEVKVVIQLEAREFEEDAVDPETCCEGVVV